MRPGETQIARSATLRAGPLPLGQKLAYSTGSVAESIVSGALNVFLLFYVTVVCGLPGGLAGLALAAGLVVDAIADPILGSISDGWRSRFGRRLPMMAVGLPLILISFVGIFSLPQSLGQTGLFLVLTALSILLRCALSVFNLPYLAVGAELSDDYAERSSITTWRWGLATVGGVIAIAAGFAVFFKGEGGTAVREAYQPYALAMSVAVIIAALVAMAAVYATRERQHPPPADVRPLLGRLGPELLEVFRNPSFRVLFISALLMFIAQGVTTVLGLHANTYFWRLDGGQIQLVTIAFFAGLLAGAPLVGPLVGRMEKRTAFFIGAGGLIAAQAVPAMLKLLGLLPFEGQALAYALAANQAVAGMLMTMAAIALIAMLADAADEHEHLFGARREALYFAGWAFAGKAANGVGALVAGLVLQLINFPSGAAATAQALAALPASASAWLGLAYGPGAAALSLIGLGVLSLYRLDRGAHAQIMTDLATRRGVAPDAVTGGVP